VSSSLAVTRIILRPLSALSLDEGLHSPCDKNVFDLTNLKGEKRRNVGKLNNELNIVNQPCRTTLPEIERTALALLI
jgi:hypothetical protein